jgi:GST-like protein
VLPGEAIRLAVFPDLARWFAAIDARLAVARSPSERSRIRRGNDEETRRALFQSNYPSIAK